jgi:hypothetical protein
MIWFTCRQCGKRHGRPESAIGTLIFCDCGQGNTVPWESTTAAPPPGEEAAPAVPARPRLEPIPVGEERRPPRAEPLPERERRGPPPLPRAARGPTRRHDPAYCFNHSYLPSEVTCGACGEHFCKHCVVEVQGKTLCGPCKNYQVRNINKPARTSGLALTALILALIAGPLGPCVSALPAVSAPMTILALLFLLVELVAFALGSLALHATLTRPKVAGQPMAVAAMVAAGVTSLLTGVLMVFRVVPGA